VPVVDPLVEPVYRVKEPVDQLMEVIDLTLGGYVSALLSVLGWLPP